MLVESLEICRWRWWWWCLKERTGWRRTIADAAFDRVVWKKTGRLGHWTAGQTDWRVALSRGYRIPKRANERMKE